jgi:TonB family protein
VVLLESQIEGKYEILEKIKEGGMGAVYKVRHRFLDEIRVVKVIRASLETSADLADRFQREARAAIRLRYPNIAQLHDFSVGDGGIAYIVMEYIDGLTLEESLRANGPPSLALSLEIAQQSLKAIGYLHRKGFVHRDIAPDNLMLTRGIEGEPLVKLIDLGIAKVLAGEGNVTSTGVFLGKPRYASPEHFGGDGGVDGRSDVYSFGVVLYELLTGVIPVSGRDPASFMAGHLLRPPHPFEETDLQGRVPEDVRLLVLRALAKRSTDRFETAEEFARELHAIQVRFPVGARDLNQALMPVPLSSKTLATLGTTQARLNAEFVAPTPFPQSIILRTHPDGTAAAAETLSLETPRPSVHHEVTEVRPRDGKIVSALAVPTEGATAAANPAPEAGASRPAKNSAPPPSTADPDWGDQTLWSSTSKRRVIRDPMSPVVSGARPARRGMIGWIVAVIAVAAIASSAWVFRDRLLGEPSSDAVPPSVGASSSTPAVEPPAAERIKPPVRQIPAAKPIGTASSSEPAEAVPAPSSKSAARGAPPATVERQPPVDPSLLTAGPGVELAEPLSIPEATYPEAARSQNLHPHVVVMVLVDEKGSVAEARLKIGDNSGLGFNEAALAAAKGARFLPATRNGVPGRSWSELGVDFSPPGQP